MCGITPDCVRSALSERSGNVIICFTALPAGRRAHLLPVVSDGRQDGAKRLEAHGDVQQMSRKEKVVEVSKNGHGGVPDQIQEGLKGKKNIVLLSG